MNILITICGRAGSKGIPNKNMRLFFGKPLIDYSIAAACLFKRKHRFDTVDVCVNSDSDQLLKMAEPYGPICIKRPEELALDASPKLPAIRHSLHEMEQEFGRQYDYVVDLDITSPLRKTADIESALEKAVKNPDTDVVFSVVPSRRNPYFNMVEQRDGEMRKVLDGGFTARQQAPKVYDMNASIYCYRRNSLYSKLKQSPLDGKFDIFLMRDTAVLDLDCEDDFNLLEILACYFFQEEFKELYDYVSRM
ncbi:acylneuraminate cytidylyltransferase family protein [Clostridium sp. KNHs216]|uniref:acylneuraminate cytidylyltransferase family protein n=1 Tax=Clostridium sp. KNHs216 TaxID=1550235 RepID=UPI00114E13B0|nr:acylneuraminate cytidylyltransferase family protein [Clostridium sp. KNHs216]TQI66863.1 CMP-N,N'-diacetyllegionaminic acid synthase [Clostridium sp. KNHs216]